MNKMLRYVRLIVPAVVAILFAPAALALPCTSVATGNWGVAGTWTSAGNCNRVPTAADTVTIAAGHTVTVNVATANVLSVTVNPGAILTQSSALNSAGALGVAGTLNSTNTMAIGGATTVTGALNITATTGTRTFTGLVTVNAGGVWNNSINEPVTFRGGITNNGTFNGGTGTQTFNLTQAIGGANPINFGGIVAVVGAVTVTNSNTNAVSIAGNLTGSAAGSTWVNAANSTLNYGGAAAPMGTRVFTASAVPNTVNYNRAGAQTMKQATYYHLTASGSGIKSTGAITLLVNGTTTVSGTAILNVSSTTGTKTFAGPVIVDPLCSWTNTANEPVTFRGGITHNGTAFTSGTGTQTFNTNSQAIGGASPINFGGIVAVTGAITITNNNTNVVTITGNLTGSAGGSTWVNAANSTLNYGGTAAPMGTRVFTASAVPNTVNYNRAGAQPIKTPTANTYHHLTLSGSGAKTMTGVTAIGGDLNISGSATMTGNAAFTVGGALNYSSTGATTLTAATPISIGSFNQTAGTIAAGANTVTVSGNWNETGIFTSTGTVTFNGAAAQTISGTSPVTFSTLNVTNAANPNITLQTNVTATTLNGTVTLNPTCPDYTLTSATPAQVLHSCATVVNSINRANPDPTSAATVSWTVIFNQSVTGVDATAFTLAASGVSGAFITSVTGSGTTWTVTANTGIGSGTLGLNQTGPGLIVPTLSGTFTGQVYTITATPTLAEYRMDEAAWNGTAGEVVDSSGSGNNAQAFNSASTIGTTPAIATNPGTCRYGVFDNGTTITQGYVQTPLPHLTTDFTVAAWIRTTNNTIAGQRILIDDQNNTGGYGLSLGDGAAGILRFYSRGIAPIILDSTFTIANNTWYFVAAVADITNQKRTIYVFNTAGTLLNSTTEAAWTGGAWGTDAGPVSIGGEVNGPPQTEPPATFHFHGNLDEVRVYQKVLSQSALAAIAAQTHACAINIPDHFEIRSGGTGVTCAPSTLTVVACADPACATPYTLGVSGTLGAAGAPTVNWDGATGGAAGAGFDIPVGSSSVTKDVQVTTPGNVVFSIASATPGPINATTCNFGLPSCTFTAADAGFLVSAPDHVAETASTLTVQAVKKADNSLACVPAFASVAKIVNLKCVYVNPATGTLPVRAGGAALNATNNTAAACDGSGGSVSLNFDATGVSTPSLQYADVGNMQINASFVGAAGTKDAGLNMTGSGTFIAAPAAFAFSGIPAAPLTAGQSFNATVTAKNSANNTTPNFTGQTVTITSSNPQPGIGNATTINTSLMGFSGGAASTNLTWNEVGTIDLNASLANYLGSAFSVAGLQAGVGRFHPAYFDTAVTQGCGTFTYAGTTAPAKAGQPFTVTVKAKRQGGDATDATNTKNYTGVYAYAATLSNGGDATGFTNNLLAAVDFANGVGTISTVAYAMAGPQTAPVTLTLRATDSDTPAVSSSGHTEGTTEIRSGRLKLSNAHGSELLDLPVPMVAQYYNGTGFVTNTADSCTTATVPVLTLTPGGAAVTRTWNSPFVNGNGGLKLGKPNAKGYVDITVTAPAWLQYDWNTTIPGLENPAARATFGVYKGSNDFIYLRESY